MSLFSRSKGNQRAMAQAKGEFEKILDAIKEDKRVDRALRSRIAFRTRSHIDQTFIEGAKKAEIYDHLCLQAIAQGETKPEPPEPAVFKVIKTNTGNFFAYLPKEYANKVFLLGGLYQTMEISGEKAIEKVQAIADEIWEELGVAQSLECLRFLATELGLEDPEEDTAEQAS